MRNRQPRHLRGVDIFTVRDEKVAAQTRLSERGVKLLLSNCNRVLHGNVRGERLRDSTDMMDLRVEMI